MGFGTDFRKLVGAGKKTQAAHYDGSERLSIDSRTSMNISHTDQKDFARDSDSEYSRTSSEMRPSQDLCEVPQPQASSPRISWLGGIPNNPYGYTTHFDGSAVGLDSPFTTRKPLAIVVENKIQHYEQPTTYVQDPKPQIPDDQERGQQYANSLRHNRKYSSFCNPLPEPEPGQYGSPMDTTVYAAARHRISNVIDMTEEVEAIEDTKREIKTIKKLDAASIGNALRLAHQCFDVGSGTLNALRQQGERLAKTERNLIDAAYENDISLRKIKELKAVDRMIRPSNPFTSSTRERKEETKILASRRKQQQSRDAVRCGAWSKWMQTHAVDFVDIPLPDGESRSRTFEFEPDAEEEEDERYINEGLEEMARLAPRLRGLAMEQGAEVERQNEMLSRIESGADHVDDGLAINKVRLERFH